MTTKTIMVTGASGHLGNKIVERLLQQKAKVIAGSRNLEKLQPLKARGAELRQVDFDQPQNLPEAFKGVDKLLIVSTDSLAVPGLRLKQHEAAVLAAQKAGVKQIVYTSLPNPDSSYIFFAPDHLGTEKAIKATGIDYIILRNNWYAENILDAVKNAIQSGVYASSTENGKVSFVSRNDCAEAAAAVLLSDKYHNVTLDIVNAEAWSSQDIAKIAGEISGKEIRYTPITNDQLRAGLESHKLPAFVVDLFGTYEKTVAANKMAMTSSLLLELTGKKPETLKEFISHNI